MATLVELADEFHLTTVEALAICDRLGIAADGLESTLSDSDAGSFREAARAGVHRMSDDDVAQAASPEPPSAPSLAKQLGMPATKPSASGTPAPPAASSSASDTGTGFSFVPLDQQPAAPAGGAAATKPAGPSLMDRLPDPIADNLLVVIIGAVVVVALIFFVLSSALKESGPKDPEELGLESAVSLTVNDCFDLPEDATIEEIPDLDVVPSVPCSGPHDVELYSEVRTFQGTFMEKRDTYPGKDRMLNDALTECIPRYEQFVGTPYRDSNLDVIALVPSEEAWQTPSERVSMCGVADPDGEPLEGSAEGGTG